MKARILPLSPYFAGLQPQRLDLKQIPVRARAVLSKSFAAEMQFDRSSTATRPPYFVGVSLAETPRQDGWDDAVDYL